MKNRDPPLDISKPGQVTKVCRLRRRRRARGGWLAWPGTTPGYTAEVPTVADSAGWTITWGDGQRFVYPMNWLRSKCPCASCVEEWTGVVKVRFEDVEHVRVKHIGEVGSYAFSIAFSDGHETGFFTYKRLREWGEERAAQDPA